MYSVRFRHTAGDVGPLKFGVGSSVAEIKERLVAEWPTEGPLLKERPSSVGELRLILSGKFLGDGDTLRSLHSSLGDPREDLIVTMHVIVRPAAMAKTQSQVVEKEKNKSCACVIC